MEKDLVFEPSEFEIIESIEFEEELQRPEELRFFTLEEQLLDYSDKVLPKKKHVTRAEYKKIENEVADILLYLIRFSDLAKIDLEKVALRKIALNAQKYPIEKSKGSDKKYNEK